MPLQPSQQHKEPPFAPRSTPLRAVSRSFRQFYETVYLQDHDAPLNRWVHFLSNIFALLFCGLGVGFHSLLLFAMGIWFQLGPPYLGHILFEKTHRSIDQSPIFAALGSWFTTFEILTGKQSVTHGRAPKINSNL